jgi:hypothetical protein
MCDSYGGTMMMIMMMLLMIRRTKILMRMFVDSAEDNDTYDDNNGDFIVE